MSASQSSAVPSILQAPSAQAALLDLHAALEFSDLWKSLQGLFESVVEHDTLVMSVNYLDWRRESSSQRLSSAKSRRPHGADADRLVAQEGKAFFQPFLDQNQGIAAYQHTQLISDPKRLEATRFYRRYMDYYDWRYSAHLLFWHGKGVDTSFALRRRSEQGDFTPTEMAVLHALHPHIKVAFDRMRTFEQERQRRRLLEGFYRAKPDAVIFLDWNLEPIYVSQDALALCAVWNMGPERARSFNPRAVFSIPDAVRTGCENLRREWQARPAGTPAPATEFPTVLIEAADGGNEALVTLRPERGGTLTKPVFVIRLRVTDPRLENIAAPESSQDRIMHQLTPGERDLANLVYAGLTNKEIAARLKKTEGSVKVQLSGIFQKLRVSSRAKLIVAMR